MLGIDFVCFLFEELCLALCLSVLGGTYVGQAVDHHVDLDTGFSVCYAEPHR